MRTNFNWWDKTYFLVSDRIYKYVDNDNCPLSINIFTNRFACNKVSPGMRTYYYEDNIFSHYSAVNPAFITWIVAFRNFSDDSRRAENDFVLIRIFSARFY